MAIVRWSSMAIPVTVLGAELLSLANGAVSAPGAAISSDGSFFCDVEFISSTAFSPTSGALVDVWMLRSVDGGTSFEDGAAGSLPPREADATIAIRNGTLITPRAGYPGLPLPPGTYRPIARNRTGVVFPASGVSVRMATYTQQAD